MLGSTWPGLNVGRAAAGFGVPAVVFVLGAFELGFAFEAGRADWEAALVGVVSLFGVVATEAEGAASFWVPAADGEALLAVASAGLNPLDAAETSVVGFSGVQPSGITHVVTSAAINHCRFLDREPMTDSFAGLNCTPEACVVTGRLKTNQDDRKWRDTGFS